MIGLVGCGRSGLFVVGDVQERLEVGCRSYKVEGKVG